MATPDFIPVNVNSADIMRQVSRQVNKQLGKKLELWARTVNKNVSRGQGLETINRKMAEGARSRVLNAYNSSGLGQNPSYRYNDRGKFRRYANGQMQKAIQNPNTIRFDRKGISFIDKSEMDKFARQWYRLNFGTEGGGTGNAPSAQPMKFFGVTTRVRASLDANQPSPSFRVPAGFWSSDASATTKGAVLRNRGPLLYVMRRGSDNPTIIGDNLAVSRSRKGHEGNIQGKRFLDAGASYINQYYPRRLEALMKSWLTAR